MQIGDWFGETARLRVGTFLCLPLTSPPEQQWAKRTLESLHPRRHVLLRLRILVGDIGGIFVGHFPAAELNRVLDSMAMIILMCALGVVRASSRHRTS